MLVQVSVENFKSIEEEVVFKMMASGLSGHSSHKAPTVFNEPKELLRLGAIYGANASGKTNFIEAIQFAQELIVEGTQHGESIKVNSFKLSKEYSNQPTTIEFIIYLKEELYTYGFSVSKDEVLEEWLFAQKPGAKERKLFERVSRDDQAVVETGKSLEEKDYTAKVLQHTARTTRINQLFLHSLVDKNHSGTRALMEWFADSLEIIPAVSKYTHLTMRATKDREFTDFISNILKKVGTGVERVETISRKIDLKRDLNFLPEAFREDLSTKLLELEDGNAAYISSELFQRVFEKNEGEVLEHRLVTVHKDKEGNEVNFDIEEESDGTLRLLHLAPLLVDARSESKVVFIDELDRRMHPLLSRTLIQLFDEINDGKNNSQLVFTSHDTNLFDQDLLRRDELWLVEKNKYGATKLKSLLEFKIRNDKKLDKDYLLGRFGGIPNIRYGILEQENA